MTREPFSTEPGLIYRMRFDRYTFVKDPDVALSMAVNQCPNFRGLFMILSRKNDMIQILTSKGIFWMLDYIFSSSVVYDKPPLELITKNE